MGNIALNRPTTANHTILPYYASRAVDGNLSPSNRWLTDQIPATLMVDTQIQCLVNRWVVKHPSIINSPNNGWNNSNYANIDYKLQGSNDNIGWSDIDSVTNNSNASTDRTFAPIVYRYYRVYVSKGLRCNTGTASIVELELYQAYSCFLTNLTISAGTLTPAFNMNTLAYTATVTSDVASINVTPTAQDPQAVIKVNGAVVVSGQPKAVALGFGNTTITVNVTDGSGAQKNYVITVTRNASFLSALTVQNGATNIPLTPVFVKTTMNYTASVDVSTSSVTFTPTAETTGSTIKINDVSVSSGQQSPLFSLVDGNNTFNIVVTANNVPTTYTVVITKAANLYLSQAIVTYMGRSISTGTRTITMNQTDLIYSTTVPTGAQTITVTPYAQSSGLVIKVNNVVVPSGTASGTITLNTSGTTTVPVVVSTQDGSSSRSYTINVTIG
jgi:hypothetical protein